MASKHILDSKTTSFSPKNFAIGKKIFKDRMHKSFLAGDDEPPIKFDQIIIDPKSRQVMVRGQMLALTVTEFNLLFFLASNPDQTFDRQHLLKYVWGEAEFVDPHTVTVHIRRLREKIEKNPRRPNWLVTIWGVGYKFEPH